MPKSKLQKLRARAFEAQQGLCHYCNAPMWTQDPNVFAARNKFSTKLAARLQCTAEHLLARSVGGEDSESNIVAACKFCNSVRHRANTPLDSEAYKKRVQSSLSKGKWHPVQVLATIQTRALFTE